MEVAYDIFLTCQQICYVLGPRQSLTSSDMHICFGIFLTCQQICYVLGPRQSLTSADMHICFGIFLYNMEMRRVDPVVACEKIKLATDQRFSCYDREAEGISLSNYRERNWGYE